MPLAFSDAQWTALGVIVVGLATVAGGIIIAFINRDHREQDVETTESVTDFERAYRERGDLIQGYQRDHAALIAMIGAVQENYELQITTLRSDHDARFAAVEGREQNCLEALELAEHRIAVLEASSQ